MVVESVITGILTGFSIAVRAISASIALLLITRSVADRIARNRNGSTLRTIRRLTDGFLIPVKKVLPASITSGSTDYSPLVSALLLLFIGAGVNAFIVSVLSF